MSTAKTLQERLDDLMHVADAGHVFAVASGERMRDRMFRELIQRGYDIDGKADAEIKEIIKHPPTLPEKP